MVEDWTAESLVLYRETSLEASVWELPDDSITEGSALQRQLMQQLAGTDYPLDELSDIVKDFLALVVSGTRVLEDETVFCRVGWVSGDGLANPVFVLGEGS